MPTQTSRIRMVRKSIFQYRCPRLHSGLLIMPRRTQVATSQPLNRHQLPPFVTQRTRQVHTDDDCGSLHMSLLEGRPGSRSPPVLFPPAPLMSVSTKVHTLEDEIEHVRLRAHHGITSAKVSGVVDPPSTRASFTVSAPEQQMSTKPALYFRYAPYCWFVNKRTGIFHTGGPYFRCGPYCWFVNKRTGIFHTGGPYF